MLTIAYRLSAVKNHKANIIAREREVAVREAAAAEREAQIQVVLSEKDAAIAHLQQLLAGIQQEQAQRCYTQQDVELAMKEAVTKREEELRVAVADVLDVVDVAYRKNQQMDDAIFNFYIPRGTINMPPVDSTKLVLCTLNLTAPEMT